jgi:hypothetical protein
VRLVHLFTPRPPSFILAVALLQDAAAVLLLVLRRDSLSILSGALLDSDTVDRAVVGGCRRSPSNAANARTA